MELREETCRASQRAIKSCSVRQTHYRGVIRVSFFRFFRFFGAQSGQTRRLAEVGPPPPPRPDLTRLSRPFFFDAPPGTSGRCLWPDLQFPVNKSLAVERYTRAGSSRATPGRLDVCNNYKTAGNCRCERRRRAIFEERGRICFERNYARRRSSVCTFNRFLLVLFR